MIPIQFITHATSRYSHLEGALLALRGGCRWIQLRMKEASDKEFVRVAERLRKACDEVGAALILDDRVHLVKKTKADGVHLGQKDMPLGEARKILGEETLIGATANSFDEARNMHLAGADYLGIGPYRFTTTKEHLDPILGLEGYKEIMHRLRAEGIHIPVFAIGGVERPNASMLMETGVYGLAVSGTVLRADDPMLAMQALIHADETCSDLA